MISWFHLCKLALSLPMSGRTAPEALIGEGITEIKAVLSSLMHSDAAGNLIEGATYVVFLLFTEWPLLNGK